VSQKGRTSVSLLWSIAWRFLRGRQSQLLNGTARAALIATLLGVTAMVIAMALMTGYREDLRRKLVRGNAAIIAYPMFGSVATLEEDDRMALAALPGVTDVRTVVYGQGALVGGRALDGLEVTLRGVDQSTTLLDLGVVEFVSDFSDGESLLRDGRLGVVLGSELAKRLAAEPGETLRLMVLGLHQGQPRFRYRSVELAGTFTTGFSEFDQAWVVTDRDELIRLAGGETGSSLVEIALEDPDRADVVANEVRAVLESEYLVTHWRDLNRELFTALKVQQIALFFVLGLIVLVSTFNVASSLVVLVREKMRDIGSLAAIGLSPRDLRSVFLLYGLGLGAVGTLAGIGLGALASWVLTHFELIRFEPELAAIYFISSVPFRIELQDILAVALFSLTVTVVACWVPARRAATILPATALRYE
jgi:lipoprotein-releasing system permease protein